MRRYWSQALSLAFLGLFVFLAAQDIKDESWGMAFFWVVFSAGYTWMIWKEWPKQPEASKDKIEN